MKRAGGKAVNLRIRAPGPSRALSYLDATRVSAPICALGLSGAATALHRKLSYPSGIHFSEDSPVPGPRERYFRSCAELPGVVKVGGTPEPGGRGPFHFPSEPKAILEVVQN